MDPTKFPQSVQNPQLEEVVILFNGTFPTMFPLLCRGIRKLSLVWSFILLITMTLSVVNTWPMGTLGHNILLLGLGTLGEVGSFCFLSVPWGTGTWPLGAFGIVLVC